MGPKIDKTEDSTASSQSVSDRVRAGALILLSAVFPGKALAQEGGSSQNPQSSTEPIRHTVQAGETVWGLSQKYLGSPDGVAAILRINPGLDPKRLIPGETEILIPVTLKAEKTLPCAHKIVGGDTLEKIARQHYGRESLWPVIAEANPKVEAKRLAIGTELVIPALPVEGAAPKVSAQLGISARASAPAHVSDFCSRYGPFALRVERDYGIPAEVCLAQAAHETAWGKRVVGNNFFGIKPSRDWDEEVVSTKTHEYRKGKRKSERSSFRGYENPQESFIDYGEFLHRNKRYAAALTKQLDPEGCIREIAKAGYATDPKYAERVLAVMKFFERAGPQVSAL